MIMIFEFLIHGCWHKWVPTGRWGRRYWDGPDTFICNSYEFECKKCHRRKMIDND